MTFSTDLSPREKVFGSSPVSVLDYLSTEEVAELFGVCSRTLRRWRQTAGFPDPRGRRYNVTSLRAYVRAQAAADQKAAREKLRRFSPTVGKNVGKIV